MYMYLVVMERRPTKNLMAAIDCAGSADNNCFVTYLMRSFFDRSQPKIDERKKLILQIENETEILWPFNLFSAEVKSRNMKMPNIIKV